MTLPHMFAVEHLINFTIMFPLTLKYYLIAPTRVGVIGIKNRYNK